MRHLPALLLVLALMTSAVPAFAQSPAPSGPTAVANEVLLRGGDAVQAGDFDRAVVDFSLFILLNPTDARG